MKIIRRATVIRRRALRIAQHPDHAVYLFALRARELLAIADISRVSRNDLGELIGYQRPEVRKHVHNIVEYLDAGPRRSLFPNSIILALGSDISFHQVRGPKNDDGLGEAGTLEIPVPKQGNARPAWIVDGQQRALALSRCKHPDFLVPISAFVADEVDVQREQFLRINTTKPLPRGLISELLPKVSTVLPPNLAARRAPAALCDMLNRDPESPLRGLIKRSSSPKDDKRAVVADSVIIQAVQDSLSTPSGCLFPYRNLATGETDFLGVRRVLFVYWDAVRKTFPEAWGLPPTQSRLMHGAGIRSMSKLMDRVMATVNPAAPNATQHVKRELARIKPMCRWTQGAWEDLGGLKWNEVQNLPVHVRTLTNVLVRAYTAERGATLR